MLSVVVRIRWSRWNRFLLLVRIAVVGANHTSAPLHLLERLSVAPGVLELFLQRLRGSVDEALVLSTCNRTEIYAVLGDEAQDVEPMLRVFAERATASVDELRAHVYAYADATAVKHALRVASGLDSMVLGEDQIQAQMKRALAAARLVELLGPTLDRLGAAALGCGKRVRAFTGVGHHSVSLESIAVDAAAARVGPLAAHPVVVLGSGSSAGIVTRQLRQHGAAVTIVGRSHGSAATLAADAEAEYLPWEELHEALVHPRVVFCCTSAPHPVLTRETMSRRLAERPESPLVCVDLGMPHDIDHALATIPNVEVVSLEELGRIAATHRAARARHVPDAEIIVDRETARFLAWLQARRAAPAITITRARAEAVAESELRRALARLQSANAHDRAVLGELARRLTRKLMHDATEDLKVDALLSGSDAALEQREEAAS